MQVRISRKIYNSHGKTGVLKIDSKTKLYITPSKKILTFIINSLHQNHQIKFLGHR